MDVEKRAVDVRGDRIHLTPKEFDVLRLLVIGQGKPLTFKKILQAVWGPDYAEETENLRVVINQLRKKIEKDPAHPRFILTEHCVGYRFQLPSVTDKKPVHRKCVISLASVKMMRRTQKACSPPAMLLNCDRDKWWYSHGSAKSKRAPWG